MYKTSVIIIGGGPAGASCAWKLKQYGIDCLILDRAVFPRDKLCAGWITPEVLEDLDVSSVSYPHGILALRKMHVTFRRIRFNVPTLQYSIRRFEFDHWLLRRSGVPVETHEARHIRKVNGGYIIDGMYAGKYLIGAGGTHCPVYRTFFGNSGERDRDNLIVTREEEFPYQYIDPNCYLWFMENGLPGYAWYVPKEYGYLNVGVGGKANGLSKRKDSINRHWDMLVRKLKELNLVRGHDFKPKGHSYFLRSRTNGFHRDNVYIIGDAAGLATRDMGEGIGPAVRSGLNAADAIARKKDYNLDDISRRSIRWKWLRFGS
jgi:menaquinone-9 beta-reductase